MKAKKNQSHSYLGLVLSGAKNQKTTIAALQHFSKENKTFLLDTYDGIGASGKQSGDEVLLELLKELSDGLARIAVNVPFTLPSCLNCTSKKCLTRKSCRHSDTLYVHSLLKKAKKSSLLNVKEYIPYTQRPIEVWLRYFVLNELGTKYQFDLDETLGSNKAPLSARMGYLKKFFDQKKTIETLPKLTTSILCKEMGVASKYLETHRHLELGVASREVIIDKLIDVYSVFIYEKDRKKITRNVDCFDAFIAAFTGILYDQQMTAKPPRSFPVSSGWIHYPEITS